MKSAKLKTVSFSNKKREIYCNYLSGKSIAVHFGQLGLNKLIEKAWVDKETNGYSVGFIFNDGSEDYMPSDQPLALAKDPEYLLQNHIEHLIARIKEELDRKKISKTYLARILKTSDNQIQRLLNPEILNKNLIQLYQVAMILELEPSLKVA